MGNMKQGDKVTLQGGFEAVVQEAVVAKAENDELSNLYRNIGGASERVGSFVGEEHHTEAERELKRREHKQTAAKERGAPDLIGCRAGMPKLCGPVRPDTRQRPDRG
jgi:hypothetical protein